jgi:hypothetical protein
MEQQKLWKEEEKKLVYNETSFDENEGKELNLDSFGKGKFLKNPEVGESITFTVLKVFENKNTTGKSKTGQEFNVGLKSKDGSLRRFDIETDQGVYTLNNWEIYFKLFGPAGILRKYAEEHNKSFSGAKISIKRLLDGGHMGTKIGDLAKILGTSIEEATAYQNGIKKAVTEQRLYEVTLV